MAPAWITIETSLSKELSDRDFNREVSDLLHFKDAKATAKWTTTIKLESIDQAVLAVSVTTSEPEVTIKIAEQPSNIFDMMSGDKDARNAALAETIKDTIMAKVKTEDLTEKIQGAQ